MAAVPDDVRDEIVVVLSKPPWNRRSTRAICLHFGWSVEYVLKLRRRLGLMPEFVEAASRWGGIRMMRVNGIGKRGGRQLTSKQQELIALAAPMADRMAWLKANHVLDKSELESIAADALVVAVRYWKPKLAEWLPYARNGIWRAFKRAFYRRRRQARREALFNRPAQDDDVGDAGEQPTPEYQPTLLDKVLEIERPLHRLIAEAVAGLDGGVPWGVTEIARFWEIDVEEAQGIIDDVSASLAG